MKKNIDDLIKQSKEIFDIAVATYQPKAIVMMFSGGDDSLTTYLLARQLGIKFDYTIHGNTRTGIQETTDFVAKSTESFGDRLLMADAGDSYVKYVTRKGFFGKGNTAHSYSYHILKYNHFRRVVSHNLRKGRRNYPILFINGARQSESERRKVTMVSPYRVIAKNNIWVNLINDWDKNNTTDYLEGIGANRNPVAVQLCRSGECMCGTMQTQGDRVEAGYFFPKWKQWIDELDKEIIKLHGWGWNENMPKKIIVPPSIETADQTMCTGCKVNYQTVLAL
jgi:3'-phosphoadenosine 5'-phosphosulfate sulfotransferase (PAPS reductase)/FAD synthetase